MSRRTSRDAFLVLLGSGLTYLFISYQHMLFYNSEGDVRLGDWDINTMTTTKTIFAATPSPIVEKQTITQTDITTTTAIQAYPTSWLSPASPSIHETELLHHAPGWTLFSNTYMSNDTLYIVTSKPKSQYPELRMMISTPLWALNEPGNIRDREPTEGVDMAFITREEAERKWGAVLVVEGNSVLVNEPAQFLNHFYHTIAELLLGVWIFWSSSLSSAEPIHRFIFARSPSQFEPRPHGDGWHDKPGFNAFILRGIFPSLAIENQDDWVDRVLVTQGEERVYLFPKLLLTDRSASHRGVYCGSQNQRIASEAFEYMKSQHLLAEDGKWWDSIRNRVWQFAGVPPAPPSTAQGHGTEGKIRITYISRQKSRGRKLKESDHTKLVKELEELVTRRQWEFLNLDAEFMTKDEQIKVMAGTDILIGVHGNGLSHLVFIPQSPISTVFEIFYPGGFAHDYQWTSNALGHGYATIWNNQYKHTKNKPGVDYPEGIDGDGGFHGDNIPVDGSFVARLIERRVDGDVQF